jgi:hypothetical protein
VWGDVRETTTGHIDDHFRKSDLARASVNFRQASDKT